MNMGNSWKHVKFQGEMTKSYICLAVRMHRLSKRKVLIQTTMGSHAVATLKKLF